MTPSQPRNLDSFARGRGENRTLNVILDTGASILVIADLDRMKDISPTVLQIAGISSVFFPMLGVMELNITVAGNDLLRKLEARIDIPDRTRFIKQGKVKFMDISKKLDRGYKVKSAQKITIPAHTIAQGTVKHADTDNYEGVVTWCWVTHSWQRILEYVWVMQLLYLRKITYHRCNV